MAMDEGQAMREMLLEIRDSVRRLDGRFGGLEGRFDGLEKRFDGLEGQFKGLAMEFVKFEDRITRRFDAAVSEMKDHYRCTVEAAEAARDARRKVLAGPEVFKAFKGDLNDHERRILDLERKTRSLPEA